VATAGHGVGYGGAPQSSVHTDSYAQTRMSGGIPNDDSAGRGARCLLRPVRARIITDPTTYAGFGTIVVGDAATSRSAREVQKTARLLSIGFRETDHTAVVVEEESGEPIAFATVRRSPFPHEQFYPEVDITSFGRSVAYKEVRLRDGRTSCGDIAVIAALDVIALAFEGLPMPEVWARVLADNVGSHAIFDRLGFLHLGGLVHAMPQLNLVAQEDQYVRKQNATTPPPWPLDAEVYVPPGRPAEPFLEPMDHNNPPTMFRMARNDPCICGSGKKWKTCCEHGPAGPQTQEEVRPSGLVVVKHDAA
jgi:SEC-C motif